MLKKLLVHSDTRYQLDLFLKRPGSGLLLVGRPGAGKYTVAIDTATKLLSLKTVNQIYNYPYLIHIRLPAGKHDIPIESVREMIKQLQLTTTGYRLVRRIVIIEDAHFMSREAQNALLKSLEEPPEDTVFILSCPSPLGILPTVKSRLQPVEIKPVSLVAARKYFAGHFSPSLIDKAWRLSYGDAGLLTAILIQDQSHPLKIAIDEAKQLLSISPYERLLFLDKLATERLRFLVLADALERVLKALQRAALQRANKGLSNQLLARRQLVKDCRTYLENSSSTRLVALKLALNL